MSTPTPEPSQTVESSPSAPPVDQTLFQPSAPAAPLDHTILQPLSVPPVERTLLQPSAPPPTDRRAADAATREGFTIAQAAPSASALAGLASAVRAVHVPGYEVLDELGRGGMGVVYKARQIGLNRLVALKMILSGDYAAASDLARFRLEAEAVAKLQHPGIVQIYDIDEVEGRPYFCLEFVDGGPLFKKLAGDPQPAREAAELVRRLAEAMHYAHQHGVVHRDLKPANVLLTADGMPKVADFGLAKVAAGADSADGAGRTQSGSILGTPSYMAPEQAEGKTRDVGPAADVYSLGAILYEALVGRPPFKGETILDTLAQVRAQEPVPPSRLRPRLPRDLETICLKCLQKAPRNRYAGAGALAEDLRRFLAREPILARPTPVYERAWKWTRRHPVAAALAALSVVFVLSLAAGGAAFGEYQRHQADEQARLRKVAEDEHGRSERHFEAARAAVDEMLTAVGQVRLAHEPRMEQVRRELLTRALHFQEQFLEEKGDDPEARRETGRAHLRVGDIQRLLGDQEAAEKSYDDARDFFTRLTIDYPQDTHYRQDLSACLNNLGRLLKDAGRTPEAEQALRDALDLRQKLVEETGGDEDRREEAAVAGNLGALLLDAGRYAEAETLLRQAVTARAGLAAASPAPGPRLELARSHDNLGALLAVTGRADEAVQAFANALTVLKALADEHPDAPEYRQELAVSHNHLGNLWRDTDPKESEKEYLESLRLRDQLAADFPTVPTYREEQAASWHDLGYVRQAAGRQDEAEKAYAKALDIEAKLAADYPTVPDYAYDLAASDTNRGVLLQTANRLPEAEKLYGQALTLLEKLTADHPDAPIYQRQLAATLQDLGGLYQTTNRQRQAEAVLRRSVALRRRLADGHPRAPQYRQDQASAQLNLGVFWQMNGKPADAKTCYDDAVSALTKLVAESPATPDYRHLQATALTNRANLLRSTNHPAEAEQDWRQAGELLAQLTAEQPAVPAYREERAASLNELGILLASRDRRPEAEKAWGQALELQEKLAADFSRNPVYREGLAKYHGNLGVLYAQEGRLVQAEQSYRRAVEALEQLEQDNPGAAVYAQDLLDPYANLVHLLTVLDAPAAEREKCWRRLVALHKKLTAAYPQAAELQSDLGFALESLAALVRGDQPAEARDDLQEAVRRQRIALKLDPQSADYQQRLRGHLLALAQTRCDLGEHAAAAEAVEEWVKSSPSASAPAADRRLAAACLARCAGAATEDKDLSTEKRAEQAKAYGDRAMELLRQAVDGGFRDADYLRKTKDFDPLRMRDDFNQLEAGLEKK